MNSSISIFDYLDYRQFLDEWFLLQKSRDPKFSNRRFAQLAGYNSSGYFKNVVDGKHGLSLKYLEKFIIAMKLKPREAKYFEAMVLYDKAKSSEHKENLYNEMLQLIPVKTYRSHSLHRQFYSKWYHPIILQLIDIVKFDGDYEALAKLIRPHLRADQVRVTIELLMDMNWISKGDDGVFRSNLKHSIGGPEVGVKIIRHYQEMMIELSKNALHQISPQERYITSQTMSIPKDSLIELKKILQETQDRIRVLVDQSTSHEVAYHLNLQLFPVSEISHD